MSAGVLDRVWDGTGETWTWLRGVVLGEWEDNRSVSQIVTDALAGFVPGLGSVVTLRDLIAVIVRLAKHPEKREEIDEWILLVAMLVPLVITLIGAAAAGVGALVGAELGAFLRAVALFVVKKGGVALKAIVEFFQAHGYGHVVKALQEVKFAKHKADLIKVLNQQIDKLVALVKGFEGKLQALSPQSLPSWLPGREAAINAIAHCQTFVQQLQALRKAAVNMIPKALIEMDNRLAALLAGDIKAATHVTYSVPAGQAAPAVAKLKADANKPTMHNPEPPEPGNTRRVAERRTIAVAGKREYSAVDQAGAPVGAKPYKAGVTKVEHPPIEFADWKDLSRPKVKQGWPDLANEYAPGKRATDFNTLSGELRPVLAAAGSTTTFKRLAAPGDWPWSSYLAHVLQAPTPDWLDSEGLHGYLLGREPHNDRDRRRAAERYAQLVADGQGVHLWESGALRQQIYLGEEHFVECMQALAEAPKVRAATSVEVPRVQRQAQRRFKECLAISATREEALRLGYREHGLTMTAMARELGLSVARVSRLIKRAEEAAA